MILILSVYNDAITNKVCEWLVSFNTEFLRLNFQDNCQIEGIDISIQGSHCSFAIDGKVYNSADFTAVWYRTGELFSNISHDLLTYTNHRHLVEMHIKELKVVHDFFLFSMTRVFNIGDYFKNNINKLTVLDKATECGLLIPETLVTSQKRILTDFLTIHSKIIVKPLFASNVIYAGEVEYSTYTRFMSLVDLDELDDYFYPTFVQRYIEPFFELRVFVYNRTYFSMAIFKDDQVQTGNMADIRVQKAESSRYVPFKLPDNVLISLNKLILSLEINSCSFDLMVTKEHEYYFLEVNPAGQFDFLNKYCNYYIDNLLAQSLQCEKKKCS